MRAEAGMAIEGEPGNSTVAVGSNADGDGIDFRRPLRAAGSDSGSGRGPTKNEPRDGALLARSELGGRSR